MRTYNYNNNYNNIKTTIRMIMTKEKNFSDICDNVTAVTVIKMITIIIIIIIIIILKVKNYNKIFHINYGTNGDDYYNIHIWW